MTMRIPLQARSGLSPMGKELVDPSGLAALRGSVGLTRNRVVLESIADLQAINDQAVATQTHTTVVLWPGVTYVHPVGLTVYIDSKWLDIEGNFATIDCDWRDSGGAPVTGDAFVVRSSGLIHDYAAFHRQKDFMRDLLIVADPAAYTRSTDVGVNLIAFDAVLPGSGDKTSIRIQMKNVILCGGRRNAVFGTAAYFVKWQNCELVRAYQCFDTTAAPTDFAEQNEFSECLLAENREVWGPSSAGQIYNVKGGSIDYNLRICNMNAGTSVYLHNKVHIEWHYGSNAGETNCPITLSGAVTQIMGECALIYRGTQPPKYKAICSTNNSSNRIHLKVVRGVGIGRGAADRASLDAFAISEASTGADISVQFASQTGVSTDFPALDFAADQLGVYGRNRYGINNPNSSVAFRIGRSGTANAITSVNATENGVNRWSNSLGAAQPMLKLQNGTPGTAARYYWTIPKQILRKHGWAALFNTFACTAGSFTVRERRNSMSFVFDGTNVSFAASPAGAEYQGTTITVPFNGSTNADDWDRYDWRDCAGSGQGGSGVSGQLDTAAFMVVEIDVTNLTGPLYAACLGEGPIGLVL